MGNAVGNAVGSAVGWVVGFFVVAVGAFVVAVGVVLEVLARIARTDGTGARLAHRDLQLAAAGRRSSARNGLRPLGGCLAQRNVMGVHVNRGSWSRCSQGRRNRLQRRTVHEGYRHGRAPVPLGWVVRPMRLALGRAAAGVTKDWTFMAQRAAQLLGAASLTGVCDKTVSCGDRSPDRRLALS